MKKIYQVLFLIVAVVGIMGGSLCVSAKSQAAGQKNWESVYMDEQIPVKSFVHYVKYGNISVARNSNTLYVKTKSTDTTLKIKPGFSLYGGVLTNGKAIMYQYGKKVYLWKSTKSVTELFSLKRKSDILVARYGNDIYYGKDIGDDAYQIYKYNIKTKKNVVMDFGNAYYCNGKYLIIKGQFHEGAATPLEMYDMKTGKIRKIASDASYGNAAIINGNDVYYAGLKYSNSDGYKFKIVRYNLKTKKKTVLKKDFTQKPVLLDKNHYCFGVDDLDVFVYDIRKGETPGEKFRKYYNTVLKKKYGIFKKNQEGTIYDSDDEWLSISGIMNVAVRDFDADGKEEMLVCLAQKIGAGDNAKLVLQMYETSGEGVILADEIDFHPYYTGNEIDAAGSVLLSSLQAAEVGFHVTLINQGKNRYIVCEERQVWRFFADGSDTAYWLLKYDQGKFSYVNSLTQTAGGSSDFEYTYYEFEDGELTKSELYYSDVRQAKYGKFDTALTNYFAMKDIEIDIRDYDWYSYDSILAYGNNSTYILSFRATIADEDYDFSRMCEFNATLDYNDKFI